MLTQTEYLQDWKSDEIYQLVRRNGPLVIASHYKGIVLTQPVQVFSIRPDRIIFQAPESIACLPLGVRIHLYSPEFPAVISARVMNFNVPMEKLELTELALTRRCWRERQHDRVQPRDPVFVHVSQKKSVFRANLDNLSAHGMSLMTCRYGDQALQIDPDAPVRLTFQLPHDHTQLDIKGKIIHSRRTGRLSIIGLRLMVNSAQERWVIRYVKARKAEILAELETPFRDVYECPCMPGLYN